MDSLEEEEGRVIHGESRLLIVGKTGMPDKDFITLTYALSIGI